MQTLRVNLQLEKNLAQAGMLGHYQINTRPINACVSVGQWRLRSAASEDIIRRFE
jgi:hypothetical protein